MEEKRLTINIPPRSFMKDRTLLQELLKDWADRNGVRTFDPQKVELIVDGERVPLFDHKHDQSKKSHVVIIDDPIHGILSRSEVLQTIARFDALVGEIGRQTFLPIKESSFLDQFMVPHIPEMIERDHFYDPPRTHPVSDQHRTKPSPGKSLGKKKWWEHR